MLKAGLFWTPFERSNNASHSLDIFRPTCWKSRITFWSTWIGRCGDWSWDSIENTEKAFFGKHSFFSAIELNFRLTKRITFYMGGGCRYKQAWYDFVFEWPLKYWSIEVQLLLRSIAQFNTWHPSTTLCTSKNNKNQLALGACFAICWVLTAAAADSLVVSAHMLNTVDKVLAFFLQKGAPKKLAKNIW